MNTRTKVTAGAIAMGIMAASTLMIVHQQPCELKHVAFPGDKVGEQCVQVPEGRIFVYAPVFSIQKCSPEYVATPCQKQVGVRTTVVDTKTLEEPEVYLVNACYKMGTEPFNKSLITDPTCNWERVALKDK